MCWKHCGGLSKHQLIMRTHYIRVEIQSDNEWKGKRYDYDMQILCVRSRITSAKELQCLSKYDASVQGVTMQYLLPTVLSQLTWRSRCYCDLRINFMSRDLSHKHRASPVLSIIPVSVEVGEIPVNPTSTNTFAPRNRERGWRDNKWLRVPTCDDTNELKM